MFSGGRPEVQDVKDAKQTLTQPNAVQHWLDDPSVLWCYYRVLEDDAEKFRGLLMLVVVQQDKDMGGFVRTAFLCRKAKLGGELSWMRH